MIENIRNNSSFEIHIDCRILKIVGIYCILLFIVSSASNITIIWILLKNKKNLFKKIYILIFALAVLSLFGKLTELPLIITTVFKCRY
jgi:hypothetical protein